MPHVVTQACCGDASCVFACPVNCIHPTPDEPDFGTAEMLYIDAATCVDCGACVGACPVGAIVPHTKLTPDQLPFLDINDVFGPDTQYPPQAPVPAITPLTQPALSVAIVGSGPAGMYAADELLKRPGVRVTVIDRLAKPYGLVRYGVAPDHQSTKDVEKLFAKIERERGFSYRLGVQVGRDVTHAELLEEFDAVLYASGAATDRPLDLPGVDLPGCTSATDVVGWYNGHPDHVDDAPDLSGERVVVVGAGNVALDVARILATDPERLTGTSIAPDALEALRASTVREIVLLARRGAADAALTLPELTGLLGRSDIEVVAENLDRPDGPLDLTQQRKVAALEALPGRPVDAGARRIVLRFHTSPTAVLGDDRVSGIRVQGPHGSEDLETGAVLRAIGYHGVPLPDLPFDDAGGVVPNDRGRVGDRTYVVGWIKRGPTGFIGTNKTCAQETVEQLVQDANAGLLTRGKASVLAS
jgi:ferredoxin--NADP+ reductase